MKCVVVNISDKKHYKKVKKMDREVNAMFDSGSDLHLILLSFYIKLITPTLSSDDTSLVASVSIMEIH